MMILMLRYYHNFELSPKENRFRPSALVITLPLRKIGSTSRLQSSCSVRSSAWFARNRCPVLSRPTTWPIDGLPSLPYSTVQVCKKGSVS